MERKEVVDRLNEIEMRFPVAEWKVCDVDVWPVLKIQTFFLWFEKTQAQKKHGKQTQTENEKKIGGISALLTSIFHSIKFRLTPEKVRDYAFSGAMAHRVLFQGKLINRYFDPIMDFLESEGKGGALLLEQSPIEEKEYYRRDRMWDLQDFFPWANFIVKLRYRNKVLREFSQLRHMDAVVDALEDEIPEIGKGHIRRQVIYMTQTILVWAFVFDSIFAKVKPTVVFGLCYYSLRMFGMNLSASRRGITSVDMQHGAQGPLHVAYGCFRNMPQKGYAILPKIFWCWDDVSLEGINSWTKSQKCHRALAGGNPWIESLSGGHFEDPLKSYQKKIILYTLQPIEPLIDDFVLEAIRNSPDDFEWWLRLHPRQLNDRERLIETLRADDLLKKVNLDEAFRIPLPFILSHAVVHISRFSGAVLEASTMGVPNIIIDPNGALVFDKEIQSGGSEAFLTKDAQGLLALIMSKGKSTVHKAIRFDYRRVFRSNFMNGSTKL